MFATLVDVLDVLTGAQFEFWGVDYNSTPYVGEIILTNISI